MNRRVVLLFVIVVLAGCSGPQPSVETPTHSTDTPTTQTTVTQTEPQERHIIGETPTDSNVQPHEVRVENNLNATLEIELTQYTEDGEKHQNFSVEGDTTGVFELRSQSKYEFRLSSDSVSDVFVVEKSDIDCNRSWDKLLVSEHGVITQSYTTKVACSEY